MTLNEAALQFFHAEFNYIFFEGKLEPAIIKVATRESDEDEAEFIGMCEPFLIVFYGDISEESLTEYYLTVLLHEMVHQYCRENEIEDITEDFEHSEEFREEAEEHGLTQDGYILTPWAKETIAKRIELYTLIHGLKGAK